MRLCFAVGSRRRRRRHLANYLPKECLLGDGNRGRSNPWDIRIGAVLTGTIDSIARREELTACISRSTTTAVTVAIGSALDESGERTGHGVKMTGWCCKFLLLLKRKRFMIVLVYSWSKGQKKGVCGPELRREINKLPVCPKAVSFAEACWSRKNFQSGRARVLA